MATFGTAMDDALLYKLFGPLGNFTGIAAKITNMTASPIFISVKPRACDQISMTRNATIQPGGTFELAAVNNKTTIPVPILRDRVYVGRDCEVDVTLRGDFETVNLKITSGTSGHVFIDTKGIENPPPVVGGAWTYNGITVHSVSVNSPQFLATITLLPPGEAIHEVELPMARPYAQHNQNSEFEQELFVIDDNSEV